MELSEQEKYNKIQDIKAVDFGTNIQEITGSLEIVLMMLQIDDDKEVIAACKEKMQEGVALLKEIGESDAAKQFESED